MGGLGSLPDDLQQLKDAIQGLISLLWPLLHPNEVVKVLLDDSVGLLLRIWFGFVLRTTDVETAGDFVQNATIQRFEPFVQAAADGLLVLAVIWAAYRVMWGHGVHTQYGARVLLPRLVMGAILINFSMPLFQAIVVASNTLCDAVSTFGTIPDWSSWWGTFRVNPTDGLWEVVTTALLVVGYDVLAVAYLVRYTVLIFLAVTAPLAGLLFVLPDTLHLAKMWRTLFVTNLFMQPIQLFALAVGFALDGTGHLPVRHLFALGSLLVVFKVPGAMGSADKIAHKLESTVRTGVTHLEHAVVRAA